MLPPKKSPEAYQRMREEVLRTRTSRWRPILEDLARDTPEPRRRPPDTVGALSLAFLRKDPRRP
jgi:hypothetical protein